MNLDQWKVSTIRPSMGFFGEYRPTGWRPNAGLGADLELPRNSTGNARIKLMQCWLNGYARLEDPL
jgi:hypothetical protein